MTLATTLSEYVRAAFSGLYVETHEPDEALREIHELCRAERWSLATWDIDRGLTIPGAQEAAVQSATDPLAAVRSLPALATPDGTALLVLKNFHRFLNSAEIVQALQHQLQAGKAARTFVVILAPIVQIPIELEKLFVVLERDLPGREQLTEIARGVATEPGDLPQGAELTRLLDAAAGLTRYEAEGAFALSLTRHGRLQSDVIWELKSQTLKKSGLLTLHRGGERFDSLGGLEALKAFCRRALQPGRSVKPRGVLLLSPAGCGKSHFCKALGAETGRPTLTLDIGALMGGLVGETERNIRQALKIVDAMAPCVCFCDELEKGLSGVNSTGDSGVSTRLFGTLLSWLSDHESDVMFVATANDIRRLPPEFTRAERLDGVFFIDLPSAEQRRAIWQLYRRQYDVPASQPMPADEGWTGAEIKSCCRLSALLDVPLSEAARNVVPVSVTAAETVEQLRDWASGRCLNADGGGIYQRVSTGSARRKIAPKPMAN
jgi:hypothetical protein